MQIAYSSKISHGRTCGKKAARTERKRKKLKKRFVRNANKVKKKEPSTKCVERTERIHRDYHFGLAVVVLFFSLFVWCKGITL